MELDTLKKLYVEELKDLYSAENQILKALPRMIKAASHKELKKAFTTHERQTREHVKRLERVCKDLGVSPTGKKCHGMEGLLKEGKAVEACPKLEESQRLDPGSKRPVGAAFPVYHLHSARRSPAYARVGQGSLTVARNKFVFVMPERLGNVWLVE